MSEKGEGNDKGIGKNKNGKPKNVKIVQWNINAGIGNTSL